MQFTAFVEGTYATTTGEEVIIDEECVNNTGSRSAELFEKGYIKNWETYFVRKDKVHVPVDATLSVMKDKGGERRGSIVVLRDITERRSAEIENKKSKEFLENIFRTTVDGIIVTDNKGIITMANEAVASMLGYSQNELIGNSTSVLNKGEMYREYSDRFVKKLFEESVATAYELTWLKKDGSLIDVEVNAVLLKDHEGSITGSVTSIRDITERKKAESKLSETKDFLESVIENSKDGILIVDEKGYILSCNNGIVEMTGFGKEELIGEHASILVTEDKETRKRILEKTAELFERGFATYETIFTSKEGKNINVECISSMIKNEEGDYIAGVSVLRDVTERKEMEHKLIQSEKLKSLGELAGGVAHDFNNVLAAILGRAQLLKMILEPPPGKEERRKSVFELKKGLEVIERASLDGAETVRRIQEFARRRDDDKYFTTVDINEIIENSIDFTKVKWKDNAESKGIKIAIQKGFSTLPTTTGSATELREVFTNIINNAVDAMPQGGAVKIKTYMEDNHILIKIEDTGVGISKAIRDRVFDPFFTTKGPQSSGLGMSVSYGIIDRHRGIMAINSAEGEGTTFTIKLPISEKAVKEEKEEPVLNEQKKARILVVEDEENVSDLLSAILTEGGHEVETASNGSKGIKLFQKKEFDLVLTDLGMHGMYGWQVEEKIKSINKNVQVALITGWNVEKKESEMR
ncbi:MAG: PAS domain S-box protein, partial [Deltaproteobacteria bacterium]|nr:PAS domain S-box protein [Deltaproteobacteria bacterium]